MITVGNAFYWFDHEATLREFAQILALQGWFVIDASPAPDAVRAMYPKQSRQGY